MKISSGMPILMIMAMTAWVTGACALDYSFGVQNDEYTLTHESHIGFESDYYHDYSTSTSSNGDTATAYYGITDNTGLFTADVYGVGDGLSYAKAWVELNVPGAGHIIAGACSSSHNGQMAEVSTEVFDGGLLNYYAEAYADSDLANATQSFDQVYGQDITIKNSAYNSENDRVNVSTEAFNGVINEYSSSASAYSDRVKAYQNIAGGITGDLGGPNAILIRSNASNSANAIGWAKTGLYIENGNIVSASGNATSDKTNVYADNWANDASGESIQAGWFASQGDPIENNFSAMGGIGVENGVYAGRSAAEYTYGPRSQGEASGVQVITEAQGTEISFGAEGMSRSDGALSMDANVTGRLVNGIVTDFCLTNATASATNVTSGITSGSESLLMGDTVQLDTSAWNVEGDVAKGTTDADVLATVKSYNSSARSEITASKIHTAQVYENATEVSGTYILSTWEASNAYGGTLSGQMMASGGVSLWEEKFTSAITNAAVRSVASRQIMNVTGANPQWLYVDTQWNANIEGQGINGYAGVIDSPGPRLGYLRFDSTQTVNPTEVDASTLWSAASYNTGVTHMDWAATDRRGDYAYLGAGGQEAIINGSTNLVAGIISAAGTSKVNGTGRLLQFYDGAWDFRGESAFISSLIDSSASVWNTLNSSNNAVATVYGAQVSEDYLQGKISGTDDLFRTESYAWYNNGRVSAINSLYGSANPTNFSISRGASAVPTGVQSSESVEFNATTFYGSADAYNSRVYHAEANVSSLPGVTTSTYAKYTDTVAASNTAVSASQSNFEATGNLSAGGFAEQSSGDLYASSLATIEGATLTTSSSSFGTDVYGTATASQNIKAEGDEVQLDWSARDTVGDSAIGRTVIRDTYDWNNINAYAKAVGKGVQSATVSENVDLFAALFDSTIFSRNARKDYATVALKDIGGWGAYVKYSQSATSTQKAASASQTIKSTAASPSQGSFEVYAGAAQTTDDFANQAATADGLVYNGYYVTSSSTAKSDASGATATQTLKANSFDSIANMATAGRGDFVSRDYFSNFTAFSGTAMTKGTAFSSTVAGSALWSRRAPLTLTATASQSVTADASGASGVIDINRGAYYNYSTTTGEWAGAAESDVTITNGKINSLSDSATAKEDSASVKSVKFNVQGDTIKRLFNTYSESGKLWMWTNVTGSATVLAKLTDSSYTASATPNALSLSGKWTATGKIEKNGLARSINYPTDKKVFKVGGGGTYKNIVDSGKVTKTAQSIS